MSEMAVTADHLLIINGGRLLADTSVRELIDQVEVGRVEVRSPDAAPLRDVLIGLGAAVSSPAPGALEVEGLTAPAIGAAAASARLVLHELTPRRASLEEAYMELTR
jgi:ABC-2 type transport system ATP-binding protein